MRSQDTDIFIYSVCQSKAGRDLAWTFFKDNVEVFQQRFKGSLLIRIVSDMTSNFASEEKALEIESFFKVFIHNVFAAIKNVYSRGDNFVLQENPCPGTERTVQQSVEAVRLNAAWLKRDAVAVGEFLSAKCAV